MKHIPVLLEESIEGLNIDPDGIYLDLTLGRAGHSSKILERLKGGKLICFDKDAKALEESKEILDRIGGSYTLVKSDYSSFYDYLDKLGIDHVDGIFADLGVSSPQLDDGSRGFSYRIDAPLDMRMDQSSSLTAKDVVNGYSFEELFRVLRDYGEDKDSYRIAKKIAEARESKPIETTFELVEIVKSAKSMKELAKKGHPAKQTFQALRIEVNHEKEALEKLLEYGPSRLKSGGRLAIISFMSSDDRLIKERFRSLSSIEGDRRGLERPEEIKEAEFRLVNRKPIIPSIKETEENRRAISAKLRILERK